MNAEQNSFERLDEATGNRLSKLRTMPIETARLDAMLKQAVPEMAPPVSRGVLGYVGRYMAIAAAILLLIGVGVTVLLDQPAQASPAMLAQWQNEMTAGGAGTTMVHSCNEANMSLSRMDDHCPMLPAISDGKFVGCCARKVGSESVSCGMVDCNGPVMIVVAKAGKVAMKPASQLNLAGQSYGVQSQGKTNLVSTERDGRWVCVVGDQSPESLATVAAGVKF